MCACCLHKASGGLLGPCEGALRRLLNVCIGQSPADNDSDQSAALWVAPGHVARHVGAEDLPLLPGELARLTIIPVQTHVRLWRVAVQVLTLPRTVRWTRLGPVVVVAKRKLEHRDNANGH